ncbi:MAG: TRAP transporter small permease subunit [Pararhodobacter sp.]|nr:TRAP transporter small permease subunit [Pararhodobacter sp.]
MLHRVSAGWARVELFVAAVLAGVVTVLILLNVVARSLRISLFWVEETAIYTMVIMAFLAAAAAIERRETIAITLIVDAVRPQVRRLIYIFVDLVTLGCAVFLLYICWIWFRPDVMWQVGGDIRAFQRQTFIFTYSEPALTLGMPKFWFWLVVPVFAASLLLHGLSNLVKTLRGEIVQQIGGDRT